MLCTSCKAALGPGITVGTGPTDELVVRLGGILVLLANVSKSIIVVVCIVLREIVFDSIAGGGVQEMNKCS